MNNDLIVMMFDKQVGASTAREALEITHNNRFPGEVNPVLVTRDKDGKVDVHIQRQLPNHLEEPCSQMPVVLADLIFGKPPEDGLQVLVDAGLDEMFVMMVASALSPGTSMIFYYIHQDSLVDTLQVLEALDQFKGTLTHTTVPPPVEAAILEMAGYE